MKFFGGSSSSNTNNSTNNKKTSSKKQTPTIGPNDRQDSTNFPHSEPVSPSKPTTTTKSSTKRSSRPNSHVEPTPKSPLRANRLSRHATEPSISSRKAKFDPHTHPLNLPPEERKRLSELSQSAMSGSNSMDIDREVPNGGPSTPPPQNSSSQSNFSVPVANGTTNGAANGAANGDGPRDPPTPPPHKSNPSSPVPTPQEDAESYKAAGNRFFKDKNYSKAIEQYSKGMRHIVLCNHHRQVLIVLLL